MSQSAVRTPPQSREIANLEPRKKSFVLHAICAAIMINSYLGLKNYSFGEWVAPQYGGFTQFLTMNGLFISVGVMIIGAASDLLPGIPLIRFLKRTLLLIAMPVELVISTIYWPIILYTPHLMLPPKNDLATGPEPSSDPTEGYYSIPLWMDLSMHALPAVVLLFDFLFLEKKYKPPMSNIGAPFLAVSFGAAYCTWVEHCATMNNGKFPYPFLTIMNVPARITMYTCSTLFALVVFWGLNRVHR